MTGKGFTFPDLVRSLAAFKRAGILVHGYLIYGFPAQTSQDLVDSAEAVRQLFAAGPSGLGVLAPIRPDAPLGDVRPMA